MLTKRRKTPNSRNKPQKQTRALALQVRGDMLRNPSLTFTQAARNRGIDPRSVRKQLPSAFHPDSSGRIKPRGPSDRFHQMLYIPSTTPGVSVPVSTKNSRERRLLGKWLAALNAAGRGDFSRIRKFPKRQVIGGVRLASGPREVQRILMALAEKEEPFEGLYRSLARPS